MTKEDKADSLRALPVGLTFERVDLGRGSDFARFRIGSLCGGGLRCGLGNSASGETETNIDEDENDGIFHERNFR